MSKKTFTVLVDNTTIKQDIQLLFVFDDLPENDYQKVAWKAATVKYNKDVSQHVPLHWESTTGLELAFTDEGHGFHPNKLDTVDGKDDFKDGIEPRKSVNSNQISAENTSNEAPSVAAGFVKNDENAPAGYVAALDSNHSSWTVDYQPNLTLWIASNGETGQTFDTISKSTKPVNVWKLTDFSNTPDNSHWILSLNEDGTYQIKLDPSN